MAIAPGTKLGLYEIHTSLGAGGMGEVYRATDSKLGRDVALKVLPAEMAHDPERLGRFRREAKSLAQLDHPNIVTIYSVEECDGIHFLTMQLVEGQPLDRLIPDGGLPLGQIIEIASALGDALSAAHDKGIVHRDLKPANVMVSNDGRVKVLDFGLAKDLRAANLSDATMTSDSRTQIGVVMGTPAYMSPEQTSGRPLDHRTDIFSMGVLLHEMATGRRPFEGNSSAELVSAILRDNPPSVTDTRPDLPSDLARIVRRCLEKDPRHRVQTARDVSNEFRDLLRQTSRMAAPAIAEHTRPGAVSESGGTRADEGFWVAVLPFKYSGGSAGLAELADGLTDDVVTNMSKFSYLRVVARGSTAQYAQRTVDVRTAAKELGARYVMEGSIRQFGTKVRIAVQLVDAGSGAGLWAETYDRPFTQEATLDVLDDVVPRIVATIGDAQGILAHSMTEVLRNRDPESLTPYEALLRSFGFHQHVNESEHLAGITALENAVKKAPDHADCWAMLSWLYRAEYTHGYHPRPDSMERSLMAARRAVNLAPSSQLAHAALASAHFFRREQGEFRAAAERALALNRMQGYTTAFLGFHFAYSGDWERGCALAERATQLNPNHPGWYWLPLVINAYRQHDAERALQHVLKINMPGLWTVQVALAVVNSQLGKMDAAHRALGNLLASRPDFAERAREDLSIWWQPEIVEQMLGDLRKAGFTPLGVPPSPQVSAQTSPVIFPPQTASGETRADEGFWVAVLPFKYAGASAEVKALADGLSEEVVTGLSRFSYLKVIARGSTAKYSSESGDVRAIGKELGARYVMEGSLRQAGTKLRLAVQLADTVSGAHLWAENYERTFSPETIFDLQDDLVPRIVSTIADMNGILPRSMSEGLRGRTAEQLSPYEAVLRSFAYTYSATPEELTAARAALEEAVRKAPTYADSWAMLSFLCGQDYVHGYELDANALEIAASAARRAVALGPSNHLAYFSLGQALWCQKDYDSFRDAAERAVLLNPMDGNSVAYLGELLTYAGNAERGMQLVERAKQLNPNHPGWYWFADFYHAYSQGDYRSAQSFALKAKLRGNPLAPMFLAAACGQLGDVDGGAKAVDDLLKFRPELPALIRSQVAKVWAAEYGERFLEGLRKAGLKVPEAGASVGEKSSTQPATSTLRTGSVPDSGASPSAEGFWIAVLPFKHSGARAELKALADSLSEEVVTGLSRFSYLRVIARGSTAKYSSESGDLRAIGKELGTRYLMEGSLRQAGTKLRLAVQLVDATTGTHLWAESYERPFRPEAVFELQDELVPRIVSTVADQHGILPRSISEELRGKNEEDLTPHQAVLRSFSFLQRISPTEHATGRRILERAVEQDPNQADAWAMLAIMYNTEFADEYNPRPNPLERATAAAQRAVDLAPTHALGYYALAFTYFLRKDKAGFRAAVEQATALNPMDGSVVGMLGLLVHHMGETDRGTRMVEAAMQLNPHYPPVFRAPAFLNAYARGEYAEALELAVRFNMPGFFHAHALRAAALGQLGQREAGEKAVQELLAVRPDFATSARRDYGKWWDSEMVEHLVEGLRKAGLEIVDEPSLTPAKLTSGASPGADLTPSIAVLPFVNMSADQEQDYFSDGLAEEIINLLAQISGLKVIARTSAFAFRGKEQDIRRIGESLGVSTVLEGSVRRAGSRIRVTAQLINAADGSHLWSERYDRELSDIFAVQDEISAAIAKALRVRLSPQASSPRYTPKLAAYEAYLKGRYHQAKVTPESLEQARRYFEQAIEIDPALGLARVGVGYYWVAMTIFGRCPAREAVAAARTEAERALQVDPSLPDAHALLGYLSAVYDLNWTEAERHFDFPMAKQVGTTITRPLYGWFQYLRGNVEQAITLAQRAIEEDPLDVWSRMNLHAYLQAAGREREALEQLKKVLELDENQAVALASMAMIQADLGDLQEALVTARHAHSVGPWLPETVAILAGLLRRCGNQPESQSVAKTLGSGETLGDARAHAIFHFLCGEVDKGADWAEKAIKEHDLSMRTIYLRFVVCKGLRASHRWPEIARMINLPQDLPRAQQLS